jgi:F0F1-type ATP synthase assembly protein I
MSDEKRKDDPPKKYRQSPWGTGAMDWKDETKGEGLKQAFKAFSMLGGVGIYMLVFVGIFVFLGYEFDVTFDTGHTGRLVGIILGFPSAMYSLYRQLKKGGIV